MKLRTLLLAAFSVIGFCKTASAVTYPLPSDSSRLVGQNQVITIEEGSKQPLEYYAAKYQMGLSNMMEANPGVDRSILAETGNNSEYSSAAYPAGYAARRHCDK